MHPIGHLAGYLALDDYPQAIVRELHDFIKYLLESL